MILSLVWLLIHCVYRQSHFHKRQCQTQRPDLSACVYVCVYVEPICKCWVTAHCALTGCKLTFQMVFGMFRTETPPTQGRGHPAPHRQTGTHRGGESKGVGVSRLTNFTEDDFKEALTKLLLA